MEPGVTKRVSCSETVVVHAGDESVLSVHLEQLETIGSEVFWVIFQVGDFSTFFLFFIKSGGSERVSWAVTM